MRPGGALRARTGVAIALLALAALGVASACTTNGDARPSGERDAEPVDPGEPDVEPVDPEPEPEPEPDPSDASTDAETCTTKVVINELMTFGSASNDEFIELFNPNDCPVDVGGHHIRYKSAGGTEANGAFLHTFAAGKSIGPKAFLVVGTEAFKGPKDETFNRGGVTANGGMGNEGQVALFDGADGKVDSVGWGSATGDYVEGAAAPKPLSGKSIGRKADGVDTDDNATDFVYFTTNPTPGAANGS